MEALKEARQSDPRLIGAFALLVACYVALAAVLLATAAPLHVSSTGSTTVPHTLVNTR